MVMLLHQTLQSTLEYAYDTSKVIWRIWVIAAGSNFAFKIAAKPLQIRDGGYYWF